MHSECLKRRVMGRSKVPERIEEPTPEAYIHVYTELIERLKCEVPGALEDQNGAMEKYRRELEKWKNHISIKG